MLQVPEMHKLPDPSNGRQYGQREGEYGHDRLPTVAMGDLHLADDHPAIPSVIAQRAVTSMMTVSGYRASRPLI